MAGNSAIGLFLISWRATCGEPALRDTQAARARSLLCVPGVLPATELSGLLFYSGLNRGPFQLLRSYKRHEESKRKIGQERSSMQQAHYQCHRPTP